jgi:Lrp/AsnC family leucine-responsive transcriptional regulator
MSKLFATDTAMRVTTDAVQVLGGYGYVEDFPAERYLREAKILQIVEGTNQIQRWSSAEPSPRDRTRAGRARPQAAGLLVADGRTSYADLARDTGLSTSAVHQRVRRLEQRGAITGYAARIDPVAAGLPLSAFISIQPFDPASVDDAPGAAAAPGRHRGLPQRGGEESYILAGAGGRPR